MLIPRSLSVAIQDAIQCSWPKSLGAGKVLFAGAVVLGAVPFLRHRSTFLRVIFPFAAARARLIVRFALTIVALVASLGITQ